MKKSFLNAVKKYYSIIEEECWSLMQYIEKTKQVYFRENKELYDYLIINHKYEFVIGEKKYIRHGNGMMVLCKDNVIANWNFGHSSWICGIDPYFMAQTLKAHGYVETQYYKWDFIKSRCEEYKEKGVLYFYNGQYFLDLPQIKGVETVFPIEYDKMMVTKNGFCKTFFRNRTLEKFVRKSRVIYKDIDNLNNNYILIFYSGENEVARMPYNEIGYPKGAVKIMNEEILKKLF